MDNLTMIYLTCLLICLFTQVMDKVKDLCTPKTECDNYLSGMDSLKAFDMEENTNAMNMIAMFILSLCYHVIGILVLWLKMWFKRR